MTRTWSRIFDPFRVGLTFYTVPVALPPAIEFVAFGDRAHTEACACALELKHFRARECRTRERQAPAWRSWACAVTPELAMADSCYFNFSSRAVRVPSTSRTLARSS